MHAEASRGGQASGGYCTVPSPGDPDNRHEWAWLPLPLPYPTLPSRRKIDNPPPIRPGNQRPKPFAEGLHRTCHDGCTDAG